MIDQLFIYINQFLYCSFVIHPFIYIFLLFIT